jgi:hypothetical protein
MPLAPRLLDLVALGIVSAAALAEQIAITRVFSAAVAYHFGFLAVSVAFLGTGAAAILVYVRPRLFEGDASIVLSRWSRWFALSLVLTPFVLVRLDFSGTESLTVGFALNFAAACAVASAAPFAAGIVVALAIDRFRAKIGTVYAFDLVGAGLGSLLVVPLLWLGPAPQLLVGLGIAVAVAAVLFATGDGSQTRFSYGTLLTAVVALGLSNATTVLYLEPRYDTPPQARKVAEHWSPIARTVAYRMPEDHPFGLLFYDRVYAPVLVLRDESLPDWRALRTGPSSIGFAVGPPGPSLIIGGGGGRDIYTALSSKESKVDVIELSELNRRVVDEDFGAISGKPYSRARVHTVIGDGRSVLAARSAKYDQIHIGFTDTLTANAAQGFALVENSLYTLEAFEEYFDHLAPGGILNVSRCLKLVGDEALRATVLTLAALRARGIENPFRNVIVIAGSDLLGPATGTVLSRLEPFSAEEVETVRALASERANGVLLAPGGPNRGDWAKLAESPSLEAFCNGHRMDVCPPTDDHPFFFHMDRLRDFGKPHEGGYHYTSSPTALLLLTLAVLGTLSLAGMVLPLGRSRGGKRPSPGSLAYFAAIGVGFLALELVLIQRFVLFLGYPTYALSVVLSVLLLSSGIGSLLSARVENTDKRLRAALLAASILISISAIALGPMLGRLMALPLAARVVLSMVVLCPLGTLLGMAMPLGLRRFAASYPESVAFAWGVNGVASVFTSVFGTFVALHFGFIAATMVAAVSYLAAFLLTLLGEVRST